MGILLSESASASTGGIVGIVIYVVFFAALIYFMFIRPQKKEQNKVQSMLSTMEIGDSVMTSSGFYGMVIDISDDTVIVEFGNNKNCRIPMNKTAIAQIEKPGAETPAK